MFHQYFDYSMSFHATQLIVAFFSYLIVAGTSLECDKLFGVEPDRSVALIHVF
jgi:hypothetical protein